MYIWLRLAIGRKRRSHSAWLVGRERAECWHNLGVGLRQRKRSVCRMQAGPLLCMGHPAATDTSFPTQASAFAAACVNAPGDGALYNALSDRFRAVRVIRCLNGRLKKGLFRERAGAIGKNAHSWGCALASAGVRHADSVPISFIGSDGAFDNVSQSNPPYGDAAFSGSPSTASVPDVLTGTPEQSGGALVPPFAAPPKRGGHAGISTP